MEDKMGELSQRHVVTILRILYPLWLLFGLFSIMYVPSALIVPGDATTTVSNIISNESLFRSGIAGSLITQLIFIFAALFLYKLFETVNKNYALLMVVLALVSVPIAMLNELSNIAALMSVNNPEQMLLFLDMNTQGIIIASIFWGLWLFPLGFLIYKSRYFPKIIGIAVIIGGIGYTLDSFIKVFMPNPGVLSTILQIMTFGEVIFLGWLVIRGAKLP